MFGKKEAPPAAPELSDEVKAHMEEWISKNYDSASQSPEPQQDQEPAAQEEPAQAAAEGDERREEEGEAEEEHYVPVAQVKRKLDALFSKVEKEAELGQAGTDDYVGQVLMGSANPQNPKVTIPLTDDQITQGLHHKVWEAIRWLAVWCIRQMKKLGMPIPVKTKK